MDSTRKKIMMVDDDLVILKIGKQFLKDKYDVFPIPSSAKLFQTLEKITPDLILLDMFMPDTSGIETIKRLKADERYAGIPVIFVSSVDDEQSAADNLKLGAFSSLPKPFSAEEIRDCITDCLNNRSSGISKTTDKKVIVAVDDAPDILRMVNSLLSEKYKVYTIADPEKLEPLLHDITPDLFLLDFIMPVFSGIDLIPMIRKFPKNKNTPIIFLTSEKSPAFLKEAVRLGVSDFIIKPVNVEALYDKIAMHI